MTDCLISEGVTIAATNITRSVIGLRSVIRSGSRISESIVMGHDFFEAEDGPPSTIPLGIGRNCRIERAIIDKNVRIDDNVTISPRDMAETATDLYAIKDGIIVIPKGVSIPADTVIGRPPGVMVAA